MKHLFTIVFLFFSLNAYSQEDNLLYSSYVGGSSTDEIKNVHTDKENNIYVVGFTKSIDYPTTNDAFQKSHGGDIDIFITKYDENMSLVWSTFLGGNSRDIVHNMAVSDNAIWIVGETLSGNYPTTSNAISKKFMGGSGDIIVSKLSLDGQLLYSTYFGGQEYDPAAGMAIDSNKNIWITGRTNSNNFRTTTNAITGSPPGSLCLSATAIR